MNIPSSRLNVYLCPLCLKDDRVEKLKIAPRVPPLPRAPTVYYNGVRYIPVLCFAFIILFLVGLIGLAPSFHGDISFLWLVLFDGAWMGFFGILWILAWRKIQRKNNLVWTIRRTISENNELSKQNGEIIVKQMVIWDQLYHCDRNNIVFFPGKTEHYPDEEAVFHQNHLDLLPYISFPPDPADDYVDRSD